VAIGTRALLSAGDEALRAGDWSAARASFEGALEQEERPEGLRGLADALCWLGETKAAVRLYERAYTAFRRDGDLLHAALAAIHLCLIHRASLGNDVASRGWLARAARIVEEPGGSPLEGWVLLCRAGAAIEDDRPADARRWAEEAREIAHRSGDADLELCALSELGAALLAIGRTEEGCTLLDEAMAASLAGEGELDTVVYTTCRTITSCSRAAEIRRASQWIRAGEDFARRYGSPHLYAVCRAHSGSVLLSAGRWPEAEAELHGALRLAEAGEPGVRDEALAKLAELRLAQGRLDEAERLLEDSEERPEAARVLATVKLARGAPAAAFSLLERRLREMAGDGVERALTLELLVATEIERGRQQAALTAARALTDLGERVPCEVVRGHAGRAMGRALLAAGDAHTARRDLERALAAFSSLEMPLEVARTRLLLAEALSGEDRQLAVAETRRACSVFERLGAARDADRAAAALRGLGVRAARTGSRDPNVLTRREREVLELLGEGLSSREIAARLFLSRKTVEHHVHSVLSKLELSRRAEAAAFAVRHGTHGSAST
jgi:DNA-binding CsgD family transcriptional regulator